MVAQSSEPGARFKSIQRLSIAKMDYAKVDFAEGEKPENPEKNPSSTEETNYNNSTHTSSKL